MKGMMTQKTKHTKNTMISNQKKIQTVHTTILSVALLDITDTHDQLLDGDRLLVAELEALCLQSSRVDQNVGVGSDAGHSHAVVHAKHKQRRKSSIEMVRRWKRIQKQSFEVDEYGIFQT
jgi:hypothetical protein